MDLKKTNETESPLIGRREITFKAGFTGSKTPAKDEVIKAVADNLKVAPEVVHVEKIAQEFGGASATVTIYVYKDAATLKRFGPKIKAKKEQKEAK